MKNEESAVAQLLKKKSELDCEIKMTNVVISSIKGELNNSNNFKDFGVVSIHNNSGPIRFKATKAVMLKAASEMLEIYEKELEPINKKLDSIELMLNG